MNRHYDSIRNPIPYKEISDECDEEKLANIVGVVSLLYEGRPKEARKEFNFRGGERAFGCKFDNLRKYWVKKVDNDYILYNSADKLKYIMTAEELVLRINEALASLKDAAQHGSKKFLIKDIKRKLQEKYRFRPKAVERAFVPASDKLDKKADPESVPDTNALTLSHDEHIEKGGSKINDETVASNGQLEVASDKRISKAVSESDQDTTSLTLSHNIRISKGGKIDDATLVSNGQVPDVVSVDESKASLSGYVDDKEIEEIIDCILCGKDPCEIMKKYDVDEKFIFELCTKQTKETRHDREALRQDVTMTQEDYKEMSVIIDEQLREIKSVKEAQREIGLTAAKAMAETQGKMRVAEDQTKELYKHLASVENRKRQLDEDYRTSRKEVACASENMNQVQNSFNGLYSNRVQALMQKRDAEKRLLMCDRNLKVFEKSAMTYVKNKEYKASNAASAGQGIVKGIFSYFTGGVTASTNGDTVEQHVSAATAPAQDAANSVPLTPTFPLAAKESRVRRTPRTPGPVKRFTYE